MSNYTGARCPVCNKKFSDTDDIVVCPLCGAPHHRSCYALKNQCAFASEHISGKEWQRPKEAEPQPQDAQAPATRACPNCGNANTAESIFCQVCGMRLNNPVAPPAGQQRQATHFNGGNMGGQGGQPRYAAYQGQMDPQAYIFGGVSPDEVIGGESAKDIAIFVGPGSNYYLPRFSRFSQSQATFSVNFSAFFLNCFYYFYRKMYLIGAILLGCFAACIIPYFLYLREMLPEIAKTPEFMNLMTRAGLHIVIPTAEVNVALANLYERLSSIFWVINLGLTAFFSVTANTIYYRKVTVSVSRIRKDHGDRMDPNRYNMELSYHGGVSGLSVILAIGISVTIYLFSSSIAFSGVFM